MQVVTRMSADAELLAAYAAGDERAFAWFDARWRPRIAGYLMRRLGNYEDVADMLQDVFVRAALVSPYDPVRQGSPQAWLFWLARSVLSNARQKWNTERRYLGERASMRRTVRVTPDRAARADELLVAQELATAIDRTVATLPAAHRAVFRACVVEGREPCEVAASMGITRGAAKKKLHRARNRIRATVVSQAGGLWH